MLATNLFGQELAKLGFNFYSGVPCSFLKSLINYAINQNQFVMSANEGDAVAVCSGAYLGGRKSVFLCQNSGLTNAVSPLTSLNYIFKIPVLGFVSLRGEEGIQDEPQHELMGTVTTSLLDVMNIRYSFLSSDFEEARVQLQQANDWIEQGESYFFVVKKGTLDKESLQEQQTKEFSTPIVSLKTGSDQFPKRIEVLEQLKESANKDTLFLATTGITGRELYEIEDTANQLYMVGSMGCISSLALGLALVQPNKKIIAIDGDGSLLMRMGSLTTNAFYAPKNLYHLLLDNGAHESTGGQRTVSSIADFVSIAKGSGYKKVDYLSSLSDLDESIQHWQVNPMLTFGSIRTSLGIKEGLGRPKVKPFEVRNRFMNYISGDEQ